MTVSDVKKITIKLSVASIPNLPVPEGKSAHKLTPKESTDSASPEPLEDANISSSSTENTSLAETTIQDRKKSIMEHLKQSSDNFQYSLADRKKRNSKIREHIKNSLS